MRLAVGWEFGVPLMAGGKLERSAAGSCSRSRGEERVVLGVLGRTLMVVGGTSLLLTGILWLLRR